MAEGFSEWLPVISTLAGGGNSLRGCTCGE